MSTATSSTPHGPDALLVRPRPGPRSAFVPVLLLVPVLVATVLAFADHELATLPVFLPAFLTAVVMLDLLSVVLLVNRYLVDGAPRMLAVATAYMWTAVTVVPHALVFAGVVTPEGLLGAVPSSAVWLWVSWHVGFTVWIALATVPWPSRFSAWVTRLPRRLTVTGLLGGVVTLAMVPVVAVTVFADRIPVVLVDGDYSVLVDRFGGPIVLSMGLATAASAWGLSRRTDVSRFEWWALVAAVASFADAVVVLAARERFTVGWYGARAFAFTAALVVLVALVRDTASTYRRLREYALDVERSRAELEASNAALGAAIQARQELVDVVSHEMRNPLMALGGFLQLAMAEDLSDAERRRIVARCVGVGRRVSLLAEDLLVDAAQENGQFAVTMSILPLSEEIDEVVAGFPNVMIRSTCPAGLVVHADSLRLGQVLGNLVANADKYGRPPVSIVARQDGRHVVVEVSDAGAGVADAVVPTLFHRYQRGTDPARPGVGLGLPVARDLARLMGGDLTYDTDRQVFALRLDSAHDALDPTVDHAVPLVRRPRSTGESPSAPAGLTEPG